MNNSWNRFIYAFWAPVYGWFIGIEPFVSSRRSAIELLELQPESRLLIVGIGTGADIPLLDEQGQIVGIDLSLPMLRMASRKSASTDANVMLIKADAARLPFPDRSFDAVLLSLILSVVPDPIACLAEVTRVTTADCRIVVMDKFLHSSKPSFPRKLGNLVTKLFGTDINVHLDSLQQESPLDVVSRMRAAFGGAYELIVLRHGLCIQPENLRLETGDSIDDHERSMDDECDSTEMHSQSHETCERG